LLGKVSKQTVDKLPLGSLLWDTTLIGFGVRRQRKAAFYLVRYRIGKRQRFLSIGRHGPWTPDTARREAQRLLGLVAGGTDPATAKAAVRQQLSETLEPEIKRYLERKRPSMKPRAYSEIERHLLNHSSPLHPLPLSQIDRRTIAQRLGEIEIANGPVARNRVRSSLSAFFNWAIKEGLIELNPVSGTGKANEGQGRERTLTPEELSQVLKSLGEDAFGDIVRLLILTGQRREEIGGLRWTEVDLQRQTLVLPPERTKNRRLHELPLSKQAFDIIERRKVSGDKGEFVFGRRWTNWSDCKAALDQQLQFKEEWRLHDLRRSAATLMGEIGVFPHIIEAILNHVSGHKAGVAGIYNRARYEIGMRDVGRPS
jgi:integrase